MASFKEYNPKRSDCLWFDPEDLVLETNNQSPFYDKRVGLPVNENLVNSILFNNQGVLEPILITRDGNRPVVVAGRQRVKAAREANKRINGNQPLKVPCIMRQGDDAGLYGVSLSENENRQNDSILEKARKIVRFYNYGGTRSDAAKIFGVSEQTISMWEKLMECNTVIQNAVESGQIAATAAVKLSALPRHEQEAKLKEIQEGAPMTIRVTTKKASESIQVRSRKRVRTRSEIERALEDEISDGKVKAVLQWVLKERETF